MITNHCSFFHFPLPSVAHLLAEDLIPQIKHHHFSKYYHITGVVEVPFTLSALSTVFSGFCLRRCFVSPGPLQSLHGESADVCGQQRGRVRPAGAEDAGTVPAGDLCWQHL